MIIEDELELVDSVADCFRRLGVTDSDHTLTTAVLDVLTDDTNKLSEDGRATLHYVAASLLARTGTS